VEIVTLVVPGFSDDPDQLRRMADFLASVDPLMPWHVTAFHPDYKMRDHRHTTADDLLKIVEYGRAAGLKYIYPGNLPNNVGEWENTRCHHCNSTVIRRKGFPGPRKTASAPTASAPIVTNNCPASGANPPATATAECARCCIE
jgi:pyruvate formate lyase activating enzyme